MIFQQSSLTVLATDDTYVEDATATTDSVLLKAEAEAYATEEGRNRLLRNRKNLSKCRKLLLRNKLREPTEAPAEQPTERQQSSRRKHLPSSRQSSQPRGACSSPTETPATEPTAAPAAEVTEAPAAPEASNTSCRGNCNSDTRSQRVPSETPTPTEAPKTSFRYEDSRVVITATAPEDANLPQDAEIKSGLHRTWHRPLQCSSSSIQQPAEQPVGTGR